MPDHSNLSCEVAKHPGTPPKQYTIIAIILLKDQNISSSAQQEEEAAHLPPEAAPLPPLLRFSISQLPLFSYQGPFLPPLMQPWPTLNSEDFKDPPINKLQSTEPNKVHQHTMPIPTPHLASSSYHRPYGGRTAQHGFLLSAAEMERGADGGFAMADGCFTCAAITGHITPCKFQPTPHKHKHVCR